MSAYILGGLPPVFAIYLALTRAGYLEPMYLSPVGWALSVTTVVLLGLGAVCLRAMVKVQ